MTQTQPLIVEPITNAFLEALAAQGGPPIYTLPVKDSRNVLVSAQSGPIEKLPADIEDIEIPMDLNGNLSVRIVRPQGSTTALPVVIYCHGGGWVLGDATTHDRLIREIAVGAEAAVVFVNYTPAPEAQYPIQIEQAFAATHWIAENAASLKLDASRMAVMGDSAGGCLIAALTLMLKEKGGPKIASQILFYPVTDSNFDTESYQRMAEGPWLTRAAMKWFWDNYAPDESVREQPLASPLRASLNQLSGLPPTLVITDEFDVLRDEGEAYALKLAQAGVTVTAVRYLGTIHDFAMLNAISDTPAARAAIAQAIDTLKSAFTA